MMYKPSSITMPQVAPAFTRKDALRAMDEGKIAIFGGGTGYPFFSTATTTALRAVKAVSYTHLDVYKRQP